MVAKDPTDRVVAEIQAGRHDGRLEDIALAMKERLVDGHVESVWRITLGDDVWDARNVTAGERRFVERMTGVSWLEQDPRESIDQFVMFVVAHFVAAGDSREVAVARAEDLTTTEVSSAIDEYEVVNP